VRDGSRTSLDQRDISALREVADAIVQQWNGVDIVFANAGIQAFKPILEMADADWHDQIDVNLTGTANTLRVFAPHLVRRGGGRIIVTSSTQGQHGTKFGAAYSASKWGIIGLMKSAALELGPHGITVNAVIPGLVNTALTRHEDRYAQALSDGGAQPSGDIDRDEHAATEALAAKSPLGVPWIEPETSHRWSSSLPPTRHAWCQAAPSLRPPATVRASPPERTGLSSTRTVDHAMTAGKPIPARP
jgi:NAD(P)-dependent dehydrogenase (short-subunit alcohol dehydrogenase family)